MTDQPSAFHTDADAMCNICRYLCELIDNGVFMTDGESILDGNRRLADISGYRLEELQGRPVTALIDPDDSVIRRFMTAEQTGRSRRLSSHETLLIHKNRQKIPIMMNAGKLDFSNRSAVLFSISDLSQKIKIENELQNARQLESIAALSGGIAHDYNNLLTAIIGNLSLIQSHVDADDVVFRLLNEAYEASMIAKSLTQKLITFSRGGAPMKETVQIASLLKCAAEFSLSGSNIKGEFSFQKQLYLVEIDKSQMGQAFHNLVMNAREAMPEGGTLTVSAENVSLTAGQYGLSKGQYVKISFIDEGHGIPAENLGKIFGPYFSTKKRGSQKGMGLGLSICHSIVRKHNGSITINSSTEFGTTVCIYLPSSDKRTIKEKSPSASCNVVRASGNCRVLLMDDEEMIIKLARFMMARLGYKATFARHGREAIAKYLEAMKTDEPFDAVILDLTIRGGMGGEEAMRELININPQVKGIVSSGYVDCPIMTDFEKYGFKGVVVKPYSLYEMGESLNCLLGTV